MLLFSKGRLPEVVQVILWIIIDQIRLVFLDLRCSYYNH